MAEISDVNKHKESEYMSATVSVTRASSGDIPTQPNNREAKRPSNVFICEAQTEAIKRTRLPMRNTGPFSEFDG